MDDEFGSFLEEYKDADADELAIELGGVLIRDDRGLHSPESLKNLAEQYIEKLLQEIRNVVCIRSDLVTSEESELVSAVAGALSQSVSVTVALLVGLYCARRGVRWLCPGLIVDVTGSRE